MAAEKSKSRYKSIPIGHLLKNTNIRGGDAVERLNNELMDAYTRISLSEEELNARLEIYLKIKNLLEKKLSCIVQPYGSFKTSLMVSNSDIDITVLVSNSVDFSPSRMSDGGGRVENSQIVFKSPKISLDSYEDSRPTANIHLERIHRIIRSEGISTGHILHLKKAKTPILKFMDKKYNFKIDISVNKIDGIQTADYIIQKLREYPQMRYLVILLKYFLKRRGLADAATGGLCSYAQFLLLLSFYQLHPLLQNDNLAVAENLGVLLLDFFQYYGIDFPFSRTSITVDGKSYFAQSESPVHIDDPISIGNNVAFNCSSMGVIVDIFVYSYRLMVSAIDQKIDPRKGVSTLWLNINPNEVRERKRLASLCKKSSSK